MVLSPCKSTKDCIERSAEDTPKKPTLISRETLRETWLSQVHIVGAHGMNDKHHSLSSVVLSVQVSGPCGQ
jgi:hypothetical protein